MGIWRRPQGRLLPPTAPHQAGQKQKFCFFEKYNIFFVVFRKKCAFTLPPGKSLRTHTDTVLYFVHFILYYDFEYSYSYTFNDFKYIYTGIKVLSKSQLIMQGLGLNLSLVTNNLVTKRDFVTFSLKECDRLDHICSNKSVPFSAYILSLIYSKLSSCCVFKMNSFCSQAKDISNVE